MLATQGGAVVCPGDVRVSPAHMHRAIIVLNGRVLEAAHAERGIILAQTSVEGERRPATNATCLSMHAQAWCVEANAPHALATGQPSKWYLNRRVAPSLWQPSGS